MEVVGSLVEVAVDDVGGLSGVEQCVKESCCLVADGDFVFDFLVVKVYGCDVEGVFAVG